LTSNLAVHTDKPLSWPTTHCPSCLADANGNFCATCGETLRPHLPSAGEFIHEFVGHYVALEGKLLRTLKELLFMPGRLTVDYLNGRRLPAIAPLRLYLTLSLILFAMIKWCGVELPQLELKNDTYGVNYSHTFTSAAKPGRMGTATAHMRFFDGPDDPTALLNVTTSFDQTVPEQIRAALALLGSVNQGWMHNVQAFMAEPPEEQARKLNHGFLANLPYMLIAALPLFALYLKLLYRGTARVYGEHLVFALHANAFAFLLASVMVALPGNVAWLMIAAAQHALPLVSVWDYLQLLPLVWLLAYLPLAMRRVYGGSRLATAGKWVVLLTVHVLVIAMLTVCAELIGVAGHG
jgi:hypothetical protein